MGPCWFGNPTTKQILRMPTRAQYDGAIQVHWGREESMLTHRNSEERVEPS
jgi:hypothetical protein